MQPQQQHQHQQYIKPWSSSASASSAPTSFLDQQQQPYMTNALFYPPPGPSAQSAVGADMYLPRIATVPQQQPYAAGPYPMMAGQMYQPYYQPFFSTHRTSVSPARLCDSPDGFKMNGRRPSLLTSETMTRNRANPANPGGTARNGSAAPGIDENCLTAAQRDEIELRKPVTMVVLADQNTLSPLSPLGHRNRRQFFSCLHTSHSM